jgi:spore maturation protein CgeB
MRILQQTNYIGGLGADRWITGGYKDAFEEAGHEYFYVTFRDDLGEKINEVRPDIIMVGGDRITRENVPLFKRIRANGAVVFAWVDSFILKDAEKYRVIINDDPADFYHGETEPEWMEEFTQVTGHPYYLTPNAANPRYNFPTSPVEKYKCDIAFLGAMMPHKKAALETLLLPLRKKYDVKIFGPNWTLWDNTKRSIALIARKVGWMRANDWITKHRMSVPPGEENQLYSSAKVSVNVHERDAASKTHVILNERTFKIPASGGFEVCDFVPPLRRYFTEDEVVMADDARGDWVKDWFEKIDYYLKNEKEREEIRRAGTKRAQRDHLYKNRIPLILKLAADKKS